MTEWISVKEKLPKNTNNNNKEIVIITDGKDVRAGWYHSCHKEWWHWKGESSLPSDTYHVTHWMPLLALTAIIQDGEGGTGGVSDSLTSF